MQRIIIIIFIAVMVSCGSQRGLQKAYVGKPVSVLSKKMGNPRTILERENDKVYVYEIVKELESTEIQQAKLTLDPIVSPGVEKIERYYFTVVDEIIVDVKMEEEYKR